MIYVITNEQNQVNIESEPAQEFTRTRFILLIFHFLHIGTPSV